MTELFFLYQMIMLSSMKIENKFLINHSSARLRRLQESAFTSGWLQYNARRESGIVVL